MKRIIVFTAALLTISTVSYAQMNRVRDVDYFPRSEVYLQYGAPSVIELTTLLSPSFHDELTNGDTRNHKFSGIAGIGYNFFVHPRVSIGIDFGYGYSSADIYLTEDSEFGPAGDPQFACRATIMNYSGHISGSFIYWQHGAMECSGALYLGASWQDESMVDVARSGIEPNDRLHFSYHITAIKFRYGDMLGGFAELGFGYRGLVNLGLSIKI